MIKGFIHSSFYSTILSHVASCQVDHLTKIAYNDGSSITYSFDNEGNVTSEADNTGTTTFQYDADHRVTKKTLPDGQTIFRIASSGFVHTSFDSRH